MPTFKGVTPGAPSRPPKGFDTKITILGRDFTIKYFRSIKAGKKNLEGWLHADKQEIWLATYSRSPSVIADTLWHEATHYMLYYGAKTHIDPEMLPENVEEQIVLLCEVGNSGLMRKNPWFWRLYGER